MDTNDILNSPEMKELFNEAKWMMLLGLVSDKEIADSSGIGEDVTRPMYEFLKVFYDHGVEADVVVEALEKIQVLASKKEEAVSSSDLTSFIRENLMDYHDYVEKAAENIKNFYKSVKEKTMNKNEKLKDVNCICVFKDGDEVKAVAMRDVHNVILEGSNLFTDYHGSGSKVVASASAKCNPDDIFDFNIGAKLAFDRLYEGYDMTPKPKRKPYNGKIFVEKYPGNALKSHKIYQVCNGCIQPATIDRSPYIFEDMDDAVMSWAIHKTIYDSHATFGILTSNMTRAYFVNE